MPSNDAIGRLLSRHEFLDAELESGERPFVSDWNGAHPFLQSYVGTTLVRLGEDTQRRSRYAYFDQDHALTDSIAGFHSNYERLALARTNIMAASGSSSLLATLCFWLHEQGHRCLLYMPPLYHTLHYFLRLLEFDLRPLTTQPSFEESATLALPDTRSVLLLTDPVWFAGRALSGPLLDALANWQRNTGSLIIVDGSFQYMRWNRAREELTASLDPELTIRIVSPSKALGVFMYRFAYVLHPTWSHKRLLYIYESLIGSAGVGDVAFARRAMEQLTSVDCNFALTDFLERTFRELSAREWIASAIPPNCGYFIFARLGEPLRGAIAMDGSYFDLRGYRGYSRVNLMVAAQWLQRGYPEPPL